MTTKSIYFTPEHELFREKVCNFLNLEAVPNLAQWEKESSIPQIFWQKMGSQGFFGLHYPKILGGLEKDIFYSVILLEELGRTGYIGFRLAIALHAYMATSYIAHIGSNELKQQYLLPAIAGEKIAALGISEVQAGSDLSDIQTTAILDGEDYIINGNKKYVINGTTADFIILVAKTTNTKIATKHGATGISLFIVDTKLKGILIHKSNNLGVHSADVAEIQFEQVRVPATNIIGRSEHGFMYLMKCLQLERLATSILAIGGVEYCLNLTWQYVSKRKIYNNTLSKLQSLRHKMADYATELESVRQLAYYAAWLYQHGDETPIIECSMAKLKATELENDVARDCLHFHGAYGYNENSSISRIYRDAPVAAIGAGASEVMRDIISQLAFDEMRK